MKVKDFLEKCNEEIYIQIKENGSFVNRGLAKHLLEMNDADGDGYRLKREIVEIDTTIYNACYTLGKKVADIIIVI